VLVGLAGAFFVISRTTGSGWVVVLVCGVVAVLAAAVVLSATGLARVEVSARAPRDATVGRTAALRLGVGRGRGLRLRVVDPPGDWLAADAPAEGARKRPRVRRLLIGALVLVVLGAAANLLGWGITDWLSDVWDTVTGISAEYLVAGLALKTAQTLLIGFGWYSILRFAYPGQVRGLEILACYAASVALNGILPANMGTLAMLLMFASIIPAATFAAVLGGYAVQKIFFTVSGACVYLYLFLSVGGSFDIKFEFVHTHAVATAILLIGGGFIVYLLVARIWSRITSWWEQAKEGGKIVAHPAAYFLRVFAPSLAGWIASLGVTAVFLAAYSIPVSFHIVMQVTGGNSIANLTSVTPGGVGVTQAFNVATLRDVATPTEATAYSVGQQLVTTSWNIVFAIALLVWAFGWSGGKQLVGASYAEAAQKAAEQKAAHAERKRAKKEAEAAV